MYCTHTYKFWAGLVRECPHCHVSYAPDGRSLVQPTRGGPTEQEPDRPYCKDDQSCCDFVCGN